MLIRARCLSRQCFYYHPTPLIRQRSYTKQRYVVTALTCTKIHFDEQVVAHDITEYLCQSIAGRPMLTFMGRDGEA